MVEQTLPAWISEAFPLLFVGIWIAICTFLARTGASRKNKLRFFNVR